MKRCNLYACLALLLCALPMRAATYYVRNDGGTRYSSLRIDGLCNGTADIGAIAAGAESITLWAPSTSYPNTTKIVGYQNAFGAATGTSYYYTSGGGTSNASTYPAFGASTVTDGSVTWTRGNPITPNLDCAFGDPSNLWQDGSYNAAMTFPSWGWVISGGDKVFIENGPWGIGWPNDGTTATYGSIANCPYTGTLCYGVVGANRSGPPPPPSGTSGNHTQIFGTNHASCSAQSSATQLFGRYGIGFLFTLNNDSYIDIGCFDLSDHSNCGLFGQTNTCSTNVPLSNYAYEGIGLANTETNNTLSNLWIHGFADVGILGPSGTGTVMNGVYVRGNAASGISMDDGDGSTGTGTLLIENFDISWNGCAEEYPIVDAVPYGDCTDDGSGGYGDGFGSATVASSPAWTVTFSQGTSTYNTQDGLDGLHVNGNGSSVTESQVLAYGNMGQQIKSGGEGDAIINSLIVGNCNAMRQAIPGTPSGYNSKLSDFCRAGDEAIALTVAKGYTAKFQYNTVYSANQTGIEVPCDPSTGTCDGTALIDWRDNIFLGFLNNTANGYPGGGTGAYPNPVVNTTSPPINFFTNSGSVFSYNDTYHFGSSWSCPNTGYGELNALCTDPQLTDETWHLYGFGNMQPTSGAAVIGIGTPISGITIDYAGATRNPTNPTEGAYEGPFTPPATNVSCSGNCVLSGNIQIQ